jgi:hypothetical protein
VLFDEHLCEEVRLAAVVVHDPIGQVVVRPVDVKIPVRLAAVVADESNVRYSESLTRRRRLT